MDILNYKTVEHSNIEIPGFKVDKFDFSNLPKFGYIKYKSWFCRFSIAKDSMGTQICCDGIFFGPFNFKDISEAINWLRENPERYKSAKRVFRKAWFKHLLYLFSRSHVTYIYWKIRHYFDPNFYMSK